MARGFVKGMYASDIFAQNFTRRVEDSQFLQTGALGWLAPVGALLPIPGSMRPRHAIGKDESGRYHSVVVAQTTADLWTRAVATWDGIDDTGAPFTATVTGLVGEAVTL